MRKRMSVEVKRLNKGCYVLDKETVFTRRKKALISRDQLTKDLLKRLDNYKPHTNKENNKIEVLKQRLEEKWTVGIIITGAAKPFVTGLPVIANQKRENCLSPIKFSYDGIDIQEMEPLIVSNKIVGNPITSYYPPIAGVLVESNINELVLNVNLSLLDNADAREIKKATWAIIKKHLPQNKTFNRMGDITEISFIYSVKEKTFEDYIRWYDLHIKDGLGFRTIAFLEKEIKNGHSDVNSLISKLMSKRVPIGKKASYPGEDRVEKGVKLIYQAIQRQKYSKDSRQESLEAYHCPDHSGKQCPPTCAYFKRWNNAFNTAIPIIKVGYNIPLQDNSKH